MRNVNCTLCLSHDEHTMFVSYLFPLGSFSNSESSLFKKKPKYYSLIKKIYVLTSSNTRPRLSNCLMYIDQNTVAQKIKKVQAKKTHEIK